MTTNARTNWLNSLHHQADFHRRSGSARRKDGEFEWHTYESSMSGRLIETRRWTKQVLHRLGFRSRPPVSMDWFHANGHELWNTRQLLADDLSRLLFDMALIVRLTHHRKFYFPRIDFDDLIEIGSSQPFRAEGLPHDYLGVPLNVYSAKLAGRQIEFTVVTRAIQLQLINSYRQYLIRRNGKDISPRPGEVVYDCGACIGEIAVLFGALVAPAGEVHLFDPIPLHTRFCRLQAEMNASIGERMHINTLAVGDVTRTVGTQSEDNTKITPGAVSSDHFSTTRLDDYAAATGGRVHFIKMDIEGAELAALNGGEALIQDQKPRLAISGYHKPEDLWEIPQRILEMNPGYELSFGHHTPINWESVFYATDPSQL